MSVGLAHGISASFKSQGFSNAIDGCFREGFRMPAEHERSSEHKGYKAGVRKPPMKEPAGSR